MKVLFIFWMIVEWFYKEMGIDIYLGVMIGNYFFIDYGMGVVIGEICYIGYYVKIY